MVRWPAPTQHACRSLATKAWEGGGFISALCPQQTIRELFDVNEGEKKEAVAEVVVAPPPEEEESAHKQSTTILEQVSRIDAEHLDTHVHALGGLASYCRDYWEPFQSGVLIT